MSDTIISLRRKIASAGDLRSVVRTMKAMAASNIGQYEKSVSALADYYRSIELGLSVCLRQGATTVPEAEGRTPTGAVGVIVFGSDQGLVGRFNETVADAALKTLAELPGPALTWAVGERVRARLVDAGTAPVGVYTVPNSVKAITPLIGQILIECETRYSRGEIAELYLFHNRPTAGAVYEPTRQRLLPLDLAWRHELAALPWPSKNLPEIVSDAADNVGQGRGATLRALIREYLFVSLFRACAESLASENASRLAAMQRADKNINELLESLEGTFHRSRQSSIDAELFDVVAGFGTLARH